MAKYDKDAASLQYAIKYCDRASEARKRFGDSYSVFASDADYQSCCSMYMFQISEYCNHVSDALKATYPNIPWQKIRGMRSILAHDYEAVKTDRLWDTLQHDLSPLRANLLRILTDLGYEYRPEENDDERLPSDEDEI